ncbi:TPA: DNA topoisomerase (ATP-hydrolyzing) subunit B, partial [Patescibacteria group bacterium]|nr:DNA topoisomerase (ATP-hydrolyzing) subunit B [Patescibacteria group bacterium]
MIENASQTYNADNIRVLEGLEAVRLRPGMYIGSTSQRGLHHLIYEIVDNSIDEALAGYCNEVRVAINSDESVTVEDNGRGIPTEIKEDSGKSALEIVHTVLHAGGKFGDGGYKVSGGLHGVGASVVNALSEKFIVEVSRDGWVHKQTYLRGEPNTPVTKVRETDKKGTKTTFWPDPEIFTETTNIDRDVIASRLREMAFLNKGLKIIFTDEESGKEEIFHYEGGIASYIEYLNKNRVTIHPEIYIEKTEDDVYVEVAFQYTDAYNETILSFANNINTHHGGTHLTGLRNALTRIINEYARKNNILKENDDNLTGDDVREGLTAIISVKVPDPQFEGQTKIKLNNPEVKSIVGKVVRDELLTYLEEHPTEAKAIIGKAVLSNKAKAAAKAARDAVIRKSVLESTSLPGKLADCSSKDPAESELFIVEGDSAGGSAKQGRDRHTQAILPLRGKIMNTHKYRVDRVLTNEEFNNVTTALGVGIGDSLDVKKLRYHKIIIMSDADVDGLHITDLVLTLLFRFFRPLIEQGYVYVAQPPLHKVEIGKKKYYLLNDAEKDAFVKEAKEEGKNPIANRFKGLGEMNPDQLWETTMNPALRVLKRVHIEDAEDAEKTFEMLMGNEVPPRRRFIQTYATKANLD